MKYSFLLCVILTIVTFSKPGMTTQDFEKDIEQNKIRSEVRVLGEKTIWGITEDQLDQLFENSTDYVVLVSNQYLYRVNKKWSDVLGWTVEELTSKPYTEFLHPEDIPATNSAVQQGSNVSCVINFKCRYRTKKGEYHLTDWFSLLQVSGEDRKAPLLGIGKDLTLERRAEEQRYALQQAEAATRLKSVFVAHMSHEIRTPLNGILGFLDLALEENMSKSVRSHLQNAQKSSHFLLEVANDIIDVSKIEANALKIEKVNFNPFKAVKSVLSLLTLQAQKKNIFLKSAIDPDLPSVLQGDENRLKQILFNLLGNAIKFTSQGKVSLKIKGHPQGGSPPTLLLQGKIKDTGIGIEPKFINQLFKPFSQEDHSMRRQFGGAGLGLYITKELCEKMGGAISVLSTPDVGTTFQFHVLFGQPPLSSPSSKKPLPCIMPFNEIKHVPKILVVEDNLTNQKVVTLLLKRLGREVEVDIVENGQLGVEAVEKKIYDLVLMDKQMPVMDGIEATQEIRKKFSKQKLPIIGLSADAMPTHREQFLEAGVNNYLTKPINKEALAQEIAKCFQEINKTKL